MSYLPSLSRVTPLELQGQVLSGISADLSSIANYSEQLSTGNQVNKPSDNPVGAAEILSLQGALAQTQSYQTNANTALSVLGLTTSTLNTALSQLQQVRSLVIGTANPLATQNSLSTAAEQISSIEAGLLGLANTTYAGVAIFGGTSGSATAYAASPPSSSAPGSYAYQGNLGVPTITLGPGAQVPYEVVAPFGTGSSTSPASPPTVDVFGVLNQIISDLQAGNTTALTGSDLTNLDQAISQVTAAAGQAGALYNQVQTLQAQATAAGQELQSELASLQGANLAQVTTNYQTAENTYQAALWAASKVANLPSLVSFLG
jgi:flagellar hook-associated protein 3 FlgL